MRIIIRYFFRTLRLILTPVMLISEKLSTPKSITRTPDAQAKVDSACEDLALYQFTACPFCIQMFESGVGAVQMDSGEENRLGVFDVVEFLDVAVPASIVGTRG
mgnify:CR=1 FL=1